MSSLLKKKLHLGKTPLKFCFRAQDISVDLSGTDLEGSVVLVWKRGSRRTASEPFPIVERLSPVDGSLSRTAATAQDMAQICTMFKGAGGFEAKQSRVSLVVEPPAAGAGTGGKAERGRKLGTVSLDLGAYASVDTTSSRPVRLSFLDGKAVVAMTLSSVWLKGLAASGLSDGGSSVASFCTDAGSEASFRSDRSDLEECSAPARPTSIEKAAKAPAGAVDPRRRAAAAAATSALGEQSASPGCVRADQARDEMREARERLRRSYAEVKYLRRRVETLSAENRVLRREPRQGQRDAVIMSLEVELEVKEQEQAAMEENLSAAFGAVIKELQYRLNAAMQSPAPPTPTAAVGSR